MALKPLYASQTPVGMFDGLDSTTWLGGEVCAMTYVSITGTDKRASDTEDGYVSTTSKLRPAVTKTLVSGARPLMLADEGSLGYGTYFGQLVGGTAGRVVSTGSRLGPATDHGSGKVTVFANPGWFAVTLDACDTTASTGLTTSNTTLAGGAALYATAAGLLTPNAGAAFEAIVVGRFVELTTNGSRVTTTADMVGGLVPLTQATIHFNPEV